MSKKINGVVALIKMLSVILIIAMHCHVANNYSHIFAGAYIYCEFLFMCMGYYQKKPTEKNSLENMVGYVEKRVKQWYPWVAIECILFLIVQIIHNFGNLQEIAKVVVKSLIDVSFLSMLIRKSTFLNGSLWFLNAAIFGGGVIIFLMSYEALYKRKWIWAVLSTICYGSFLFNVGHMDSWWELEVGVFIRDGIPRAMAGIFLGVFVRMLVEDYRNSTRHFINKYVARICVWSFFIVVMFGTYFVAWSVLDFLWLILFAGILFLNGIDENYLSFSWIEYINDINFFVYLMQVFVIHVFLYTIFTYQSYWEIVVTVIVDILVAALMFCIKKKYNMRCKEKSDERRKLG